MRAALCTLPQSTHPPTPPNQQDSELGNAGRGSNLSFGGLVECDASVMAGDGAFGAVAAAPGERLECWVAVGGSRQ